MKTYNRLITKLREQHNMTLIHIAAAVGYDVSHLGRVRKGERKLNLQLARDLADTFNLSKLDRGRLLREVQSYHNCEPSQEDWEAIAEAIDTDK